MIDLLDFFDILDLDREPADFMVFVLKVLVLWDLVRVLDPPDFYDKALELLPEVILVLFFLKALLYALTSYSVLNLLIRSTSLGYTEVYTDLKNNARSIVSQFGLFGIC